MRYVAVLALATISGCASFSDGVFGTYQRTDHHADDRRSRLKAQSKFIDELRPGIPEADVVAILGTPQRTDFVNGGYVRWFDPECCDPPIYMRFDGGKLSGWVNDQAAVTNREMIRACRIRTQEEDTSANLRAIGAALQNASMQNQLNRIEQNQFQQRNSGRGIHQPY